MVSGPWSEGCELAPSSSNKSQSRRIIETILNKKVRRSLSSRFSSSFNSAQTIYLRFFHHSPSSPTLLLLYVAVSATTLCCGSESFKVSLCSSKRRLLMKEYLMQCLERVNKWEMRRSSHLLLTITPPLHSIVSITF
jgi:hypothetical protein